MKFVTLQTILKIFINMYMYLTRIHTKCLEPWDQFNVVFFQKYIEMIGVPKTRNVFIFFHNVLLY
jgi:hypothetical protein